MLDLARFAPLARAIARGYFLPGADRDDVEQEALVAAWVALRDYRPEHGVPVEAFVRFVVKRRLDSAVKAANRAKHRHLNERALAVVETEDGELDVLDTLPSPGDDPAEIVVARERAHAILKAIRDDLTPLERRVLIGFANGRSFREIHAEVGGPISHHAATGIERFKRVENALERARRKLADPPTVAQAA